MRRVYGSGFIRSTCVYPNCNGLQYLKGTVDGHKFYGKYCNLHKKKIRRDIYSDRKSIQNDKCIRCGWSEGPCDRHRLNNEVGYIPENVRILCPNCHRLVSLGLINL